MGSNLLYAFVAVEQMHLYLVGNTLVDEVAWRLSASFYAYFRQILRRNEESAGIVRHLIKPSAIVLEKMEKLLEDEILVVGSTCLYFDRRSSRARIEQHVEESMG